MIRNHLVEATIAILYEHPEWFKPLFAELDRRGVAYELWLAHKHSFDPRLRELPTRLVINRMSPSSYLRGHGSGIFYTRQLLVYLEEIGVPVVNGYPAFVVETSKALQIAIFERLGLRYPRTRVINHAALALTAAEGLKFPIVIKPNIGGSGARIQRFNAREELQQAVATGSMDFGFDGTALVQEFLPARDGAIMRVEVLDGKFLYAIKIVAEQDGNFNLCPADICQDEDGASQNSEMHSASFKPSSSLTGDFDRCARGRAAEKRRLPIEAVTPPREVIDAVLKIAREAHLDVGGIEYLVNERDGEVYFYDVNALSNFVTDAPRIVGFDPYVRLVDYVCERAQREPPRVPRAVAE